MRVYVGERRREKVQVRSGQEETGNRDSTGQAGALTSKLHALHLVRVTGTAGEVAAQALKGATKASSSTQGRQTQGPVGSSHSQSGLCAPLSPLREPCRHWPAVTPFLHIHCWVPPTLKTESYCASGLR